MPELRKSDMKRVVGLDRVIAAGIVVIIFLLSWLLWEVRENRLRIQENRNHISANTTALKVLETKVELLVENLTGEK